MKTIHVVAAIIRDGGRIFAVQRGSGAFEGGWEFPGGKIERGETPPQALVREIREELATDIHVAEKLITVHYDYPTFHLNMDCYWCTVIRGQLELLEAQSSKWLTLGTLDSVNWLPADIAVVDAIRKALSSSAG